MDTLLELAGAWLARAYAVYGLALLIPAIFFLDLALLGAVLWMAGSHARGRRPWPGVPERWRRPVRLALEIVFGLINPLLYLAILMPALPPLRSGADWWLAPLQACAWILLAAFWGVRLFGSALDAESRGVRAGVRLLLAAAIACVSAFAVKDAWVLIEMEWSAKPALAVLLTALRLGPLYLIPAVLLWDYLRATASTRTSHGLFLLPGRAARVAVACVAAVALATLALAAHRRSDDSVRGTVAGHREAIRAAAARHGVDPRLIAAIVYVTHRDQLSPFRDTLERVMVSAWAMNMRREFGLKGPEQAEVNGTDENPMLNLSLDISVGLAQIKPRTAQTASVLATGLRPDDLPKPEFYSYRDVEPLGDGWTVQTVARTSAPAPIPVPAERRAVAGALLDARTNLDTCALILALYQSQWERVNPAWSLRGRPEILATLYQIGFARSRPHGAPRSNAFGDRVREVHDQPWLAALFR